MSDHTIAAFTKGTQNLISPELIASDAAQDSLGWITQDGKIVLSGGRNLIGNLPSSTVIVDSYSELNQDSTIVSYTPRIDGQTFLNVTESVLDSCKFSFAANTGSPTGSGFAAVYAHTGTFGSTGLPTGSPLATSDVVDVTTLAGGVRTFTFSGANRITLATNTPYVVVFYYTGGTSTDHLNINIDNSSPTHQGNAVHFGTFWATASYDVIFYVYGVVTQGTSGKISGLWFGYKTDGSKVMYRKIATKIQYLKNGIWTDIITGLTTNSDYTAPNYSSLAGAFTFFVGQDGIWKVINAFPENPINMTSSTKNFKGFALIDRSRMLLWNRPEDKTGLYGSYIDRQDGTVYTTVTGEATSSSGTLAFKGSHATANCFGVTITVTGTGEVFTDNYLGVLTGSAGHTGTINYVTGAYVLTTGGGAGTANYQWEDSNAHGVTDFTHSSTRLAGEGFQFPQDQGGDAILNVLIGQDGTYYSEKKQSFYQLSLDDTDLGATNTLYRNDLGVPSFRAGISTNKGVVFINTANPAKPEMTILQKSIVTNNVEPTVLFPEFKFANYDFSDCDMNTWERFVTVLCKKQLSFSNDTLLLCDIATGTVDAIPYSGRCSAKDQSNFYVGHPLTENIYQLFSGFDDDGISITNYWIGKSEQYQMAVGFARSLRYQIGERLKKFRREKIKGTIAPTQKIEIYVDCDDSGFQLVGTILGTGSYVDYASPQSIGSNMIGHSQIGGDDTITVAYPFFTDIKVKLPKFRTRTIKLVATGIGYVDIQFLSDFDIMIFEQRLPTRFRQKQNVSLDGTTTNIPQT